MANPIIQQESNGLQDQFNSLVDSNNILKEQVDSLQRVISDTRDSIQNMLQQQPSDTTFSLTSYDWSTILWLLSCIVIGGGLLWGIWRFWEKVIPSQYKAL
jgi:hypothetical protein